MLIIIKIIYYILKMVQRIAPIRDTKYIFLMILLFSLIKAELKELNLGNQEIINEILWLLKLYA